MELAPTMSLSIFSDGLLEALPHGTLPEKLDYVRSYFGRLDVSVERARQELQLNGKSSLPDDVALLIIQRGGSHGNHPVA